MQQEFVDQLRAREIAGAGPLGAARSESPPRPAYPPPAYAYYTVAVLMLAYVFAFMGRIALSLLIDQIRRDLHVNDTQVSLLAGLPFVICFMIFSFPVLDL